MVIECTIRTPQFKGSQEVFEMKDQTGTFDTESLLFTPDNNFKNNDGSVFAHKVQFHSREQFNKYRIK
jgi:hypothetical protein